MVDGRPVPGIGGDRYLPYEQRTGNESIVYFTREPSAAGLREACSRVAGDITGKVAVKVHTGEEHGPTHHPAGMGAGAPRPRPARRRHRRDEHLLRGQPWHHRAAPQGAEGQRLGLRPGRHPRRVGHRPAARDRRHVVPRDVGGRRSAQLRLAARPDPFQGARPGRFRRGQQEHRHRMRRRAHRQGVDPHAGRHGRPVGHRRGGVHGAHDRVLEGGPRPFRTARRLRQRHAEHVGLVRHRSRQPSPSSPRTSASSPRPTCSPSTRPASTSSTP